MSTSIFDLSTSSESTQTQTQKNDDDIREFLSGFSLVNKIDYKTKIKPGVNIAYRRVPDASGNSKFLKGGVIQRIQGDQIYIKTKDGFDYNVNMKSLDVVWVKSDASVGLSERVADLENDVLKLTKLCEAAIKRIADLENHNKKK